jgi:ABC-2 type transport system permease protein
MSEEKRDVSLEGNKLPTSVQQVGIIAKNEMLNYFRSRRFLILLIIGLVISGLLTFAVADRGISNVATNPVTGLVTSLQFYSTWWGDSATFVVVISAIFFGGDAISGEFQNKTGYFLVGNPIRRSSIYVGKWIAAFIGSLIVIVIFTAITIANGVYYFGGNAFPSQFGEAWVFSIVYLIAALGFAFFFSSMFKSSSMSILVTAVLLLFGFSIISELSTVLINLEPWYVLTYGAGIIGDVLMSTYPAHETTTPLGKRFTLTSYNPSIPEGLAIMIIYFAVTAVLGLLLFERKEFN